MLNRWLWRLRRFFFNLRLGDPADYWEYRHRTWRGHPGAIGLPEFSREENELQYQVKVERVRDAILELFPDPKLRGRALDAGCGTGRFSKLLADLGLEVYGVDFSETAIEEARKHVPTGRFQKGEIGALDLGRRFGLVICIDVLYHVVDDSLWMRALANLRNQLEPGGVLIIQEHFVDEADSGPSDHGNHRTLRDYELALREVGLQTDRVIRYSLPVGHGWKDLVVTTIRMQDR